MEAINERINDSIEELLRSTDQDYDRFVKGMIRAFRETLDVELEPTYIEKDLDEVSTGDVG